MLAYDRLALDRGSIRRQDIDGRLHVDLTPVSKAMVCPYIGKEIPGYEELGLDQEKVYNLFRDPEEIQRAAPSFNKLPVLSSHVPVDAENYAPELVVGATGERAVFKAPYLLNSLVIWAQPAIDGIVDNSKKELSAAYHYTPDMTPGETPDGESFDGIMRNIIGNHVALVVEGRAGHDVVVGDAMPKEILEMAKAKIDFTPVLKKPELAKLLAKDATPEGLAVLLEALSNCTPAAGDAGVMEPPVNAAPAPMVAPKMEQDAAPPMGGAAPAPAGGEAPMAPAAGGGGVAGIKQFLAGKLTPEDMATLEKMIAALGGEGGGEDPAAKDDDMDGMAPAQDEDDGIDDNAAPVLDPYDTKRNANPMSGAMDAAVEKKIAAAVKVATDTATKVQRDIYDARQEVKGWVGELSMSFDSGEQVRRHALKMLKVEGAETLPSEALSTVLKLVPQPGVRAREDYAPAMDAAAAKSLAERYPGFDKIGFA